METKRREKLRTGLFTDSESADRAFQAALDRGYNKDEISVLMSDKTRKKFYGSEVAATVEKSDKSMEGLAIGGALGGTVLGVIGAIVALSSTIVIPGIGLVIAGPLAAGLIGAGAGSITGGLIGTLIGAGIPEEHARVYEKGLNEGGIVILVRAKPNEDTALMEDWKKYKGRDIY